MVEKVQDIEIDQGATFQLRTIYKTREGDPILLPSHKAFMQVRRRYGSTALMTLTSDDGEITINTTTGEIDIEAAPEKTALLPGSRTCVYDIKIKDSVTGEVIPYMSGSVVIHPSVTQIP